MKDILPYGFLLRASASIIDIAIWFCIIAIFIYLLPDVGFLLGFILLSVGFTIIEKFLVGGTLGQAIIGLKIEKSEVKHNENVVDKFLKLISWIIPIVYLLQIFWVKTLPNEEGWYDKALRKKVRVGRERKTVAITYLVLTILLMSVATIITSYFILLPF